MQIDNMLSESVQLLFIGMGTVFCILLLLIVCLSFMSSFMPAPVKTQDEEGHRVDTTPETGIVAAIQAAIHSYRSAPDR